MDVRSFETADEAAVIALWDACGLLRPWNDPRKDIGRKLRVQRELFLVGTIDGVVVASAMAGYDGHRGWVNYLAVLPEHRKAGLGHRMMEEVEARLVQLGCPKLNLQVRGGNDEALKFYERIGYTVDDVVGLGKRLEVDASD